MAAEPFTLAVTTYLLWCVLGAVSSVQAHPAALDLLQGL